MPSYNITDVEYTKNIGEPISMDLCDCEYIIVTYRFVLSKIRLGLDFGIFVCFKYGPLILGAFIYKNSCDLAFRVMACRSFSKSGQFNGNFLYSIYVFNYD